MIKNYNNNKYGGKRTSKNGTSINTENGANLTASYLILFNSLNSAAVYSDL
jgi:hypothetical protein